MAMKNGASDFITKPFSPDHLGVAVEKAVGNIRLAAENRALRSQLEERFSFDNIVGRSPAMREVFDAIRKIADTNANVLITGESGTGKELIARSIHANSSRRNRPFVPLNCGGIPEHLVESELFGHEKGAFTGAATTRPGLLEFASTGTFFLDEISELPLNLQVKLLRVLDDRRIRRVGSNREIDIDIRLISATNRSIQQMVKEGTFREDLFYRVNTFVIHLPPLRERLDDIPLLAVHFLKRYTKSTSKVVEGVAPEVMSVLKSHAWNGNVRELQHVIERAVALTAENVIRLEDLPGPLWKGAEDGVGSPEERSHFDLPFKDAKEAMVESFERKYILKLLAKHKGNISRAAEGSGIDRRSLHRLLVKHRIEAPKYA
jgi:DNA-binding NtrC family response regulator